MHRDEVWVEIPLFARYAISNHGRIMNTHTRQIKIPTPNQQGIPSVNLMHERIQYRRSVAVLVAKAFLDPPMRPTFDTPINLDGDRRNNHVDNLMWRPRWFAVKYHAQLKKPPIHQGSVENLATGEIFISIRDAAIKYGLLEREIVISAVTNVPVFPTWQIYRFMDV